MGEFFRFLQQSVDPYTIGQTLAQWKTLLLSGDVFFWLFIITIIRYDVPAFCIWIVNMVRPSAFHPPEGLGVFEPFVSVIIAGRNPGEGIRKTIRSVLDSGYPNVEVLYADDFSTDDSVMHARSFERTGSVRVFASSQHTGKPSNLNIAIMMARGDLAFVLDADAEVEFGTIYQLVQYFRDPAVGGVSANIFVRNAGANLLSRLQEVEYALNNTIARIWHAAIGLLPILPGSASMFRMGAIRQVGGYDTGLGDDTDMTLRMRKRGWELRFAMDARIWTDQPLTISHLLRQRIRWDRNMVKIRLRKHFDLAFPRYGLGNTLLGIDNIFFRVLLPLYAVGAITYGLIHNSGDRPVLFTSLYLLFVFFVCCKMLIAKDLANTPPLFDLVLAPLYPIYRFGLRTVSAFAIARELLRIRMYHPYVPRRIWSETPHW